jgi:hypothetical protein
MKLHTYLLLLSGFVALSAHAAKLPIMALPATITVPGDYYFPSDLNYTVPVDFAIVVNAPGPVTIDMKGFTLRGSAQAIQILSDNVTVKNGTITGFERGIEASHVYREPPPQAGSWPATKAPGC